jgi:hypothetical protein
MFEERETMRESAEYATARRILGGVVSHTMLISVSIVSVGK